MRHLLKLFTMLLVLVVSLSCGGTRPGNGENFEIDITGTSILRNAEVTLYCDEKEIAATTTDVNGVFEFMKVQSLTNLRIQVCKGAFYSVATDSDVSFTGCLEHYIPQTQESVSVVVDFLSTFVTKYNEMLEEKTALEEWQEYLSITTLAAPELQNSLTDATKRYLWQQALSKLAGQVSEANSVNPESIYSTENLFNMLILDLVDDSIINGSTKQKFGSLDVNALVLKNFIADKIPEVSEKFSAADLKNWTEKIRYSDAKFLGGDGEGKINNEIKISLDVYPEGNKGAHPDFYNGEVTIEAIAEPEILVVSLKCYASGEELSNDSSSDNEFLGKLNTVGKASLNEETGYYEIQISCDASDGISLKTATTTIKIDNEAPQTTAVFYEHGTNIVTGTEENPAKNKIDVKVQASHEKYSIEDLYCFIENYSTTNTASSNYQYNTVVNTADLPEGKNSLRCIVTMNQSKFTTDFDFYVKNTVSATVKPFIANALSEVESVNIQCGENFKEHYTTLENISLLRGQICIVSVKGGKFKSVTLSSDEEGLREFNSTLSTVIIPESDADIIITPITTIAEYIYSSRVSAGDEKAETFIKAKERLSNHFSNAFTWSDEPRNTKSADNNTKYYILLAGLENLAYFLEMQINASHGTYNIGNILDLLRDDYSDQTFDGRKNGLKLVFGEENSFDLDSNFFRYYYATAIKRFLKSGFNKTNISNLDTLLNQISMNSDQYLFPADSETVAIDSDGPVIEITQFQNLAGFVPNDETDIRDDAFAGEIGFYIPLGEETTYTNTKNPYYAKAFVLEFNIKSNNGNFIDLNSVEISEHDSAKFEYTRLLPAEIPDDGFTDEDSSFTFLVEYDDSDRAANEKPIDFTITINDVAFNSSTATVKTFLDSKAPAIDITLNKEITNGNDNFRIFFDIADNAISETQYCINKITVETDAETGEDVNVRTKIKCPLVSFSEPQTSYSSEVNISQIIEYITDAESDGIISEVDGIFEFEITATDKAGNQRTEIKEFEVDTTPPNPPSFYSYNSNDQLYLFQGLDLYPKWIYITKGTSIKIHLSHYDSDVSYWNVKLRCCAPGEDDSLAISQNCSSQEEWFEKYNVATDDTVTFEDMPETTVCMGSVNACDKLNNCSELQNPIYTTDELGANIQNFSKLPKIWFTLWNTPPEFQSYSDEITKECTTKLPCENKPSCVLSQDSFWNPNTRGMFPHVMVYFSNANSVKIKSMGGDWEDRFCIQQTTNTCNNGFYCDLRGSKTGYDNFKITACDILGNCSSENISFQMDSGTVEPINLKLTRTFFTDSTNTKLTWTKKDGVTYTCKISKEGDTTFSQDCSNGQTIKSSNLNGTGLYTITVNSESLQTKRSDFTSFTYFKTSDLITSFTPITKQIVKANGFFKFNSAISSLNNLAQITKIEYFLYGLYKNGSKVNETEYPVKSNSYSTPISYINNTVTSDRKLDVYGQLQNLRAKITFADGTTITRNSGQTAANSFLYCLLGNTEQLDDIQMNFSNNLLSVTYNKPDCFAGNEYKISVETKNPSKCSNIPTGARPGNNTRANTFEHGGGENAYWINATHTLYSHHDHCSGGACAILAGCYADIHAFSKETSAKIVYTPLNKTYTVKANSFDWNNVSISKWDHYSASSSSCSKCDKLPKSLSCEAGTSETITLK